MRKRLFVLIGVLLLLDLFSYRGIRAYRQVFNTSVSVTSSNSPVTFTDNGSGGSSAAFLARRVTIISASTSANTCYFDLKDTVATTADTPIEPGGAWNEPYTDASGSSNSGWAGMGAICAGGGTATFLVKATR